MAKDELLQRITVNPDILSGKPIIRGMRITVELILSLLRQEESWDAILLDYPDLEAADIQACLEYARTMVANDSLDAVEVVGR